MNELYTTEEISKMFRVVELTVRRWALSKKYPFFKIGHRWYIKREDIEKIITNE